MHIEEDRRSVNLQGRLKPVALNQHEEFYVLVCESFIATSSVVKKTKFLNGSQGLLVSFKPHPFKPGSNLCPSCFIIKEDLLSGLWPSPPFTGLKQPPDRRAEYTVRTQMI